MTRRTERRSLREEVILVKDIAVVLIVIAILWICRVPFEEA